MKKIAGIKDIVDTFDTFILDQWGVLHNGGKVFKAALDTLKFLQKNNKKVAVVSNSGKFRDATYETLKNAGIARELYMDVVTAGDHMKQNFTTGKFETLGKNALFLTWDNDVSALTECGIKSCTLADASFILCTGVDRCSMEAYEDDLHIAKQRGLQLVVSNPDLVSLDTAGELAICPGAVAKAYENMGGIVHWHGKPDREIYSLCKTLIGGWHNAIAVGDSLLHDIAGANGIGIESLFITSGIHHAQCETEKHIQGLTKTHDAHPTYYTDWFAL